MGADKSAENTPNAPNLFGPICLHKPKSLEFTKKKTLWVSVVRDFIVGTRTIVQPKETKSPSPALVPPPLMCKTDQPTNLPT